MWRMVGRECIVGDGCKFKFDAIFDWQPMKLMKEVCRGAVWMASDDIAGNRILDSLQLSQLGFRDAVENRIAIVEAGLNKVNCDCYVSVGREGVANVTKSTDVIEGGLTN
jgi:hypothetical protein